ncbi:MAG: tyrosine-type recombinase/integrase [Anaerolineae bacterium]
MDGESLVSAFSDDASPAVVHRADQNPARVYLSQLNSDSGRRTMLQALERIAAQVSGNRATADTLDWAALRFQHTAAIRTALARDYKPATVNKMLSALRGTLAAAWRLGQMSAEDYQRAADVKGLRGETLPRGRAATAGEIAALLEACAADPTPAGARDGALLALLYGSGARRAEVIGLDLADYDPGSGRLVLRGKGHKERAAFAINGVQDALADWLTARGLEPGPLFLPVNKGGRVVQGQRMTAQVVYNVLAKRCRQAGVSELSPHDLRRTFVGDLLDAGADIATVQRMAGHANVQTTTRYDRRPEEARRKAAQLLHVPYQRRRRG